MIKSLERSLNRRNTYDKSIACSLVMSTIRKSERIGEGDGEGPNTDQVAGGDEKGRRRGER